MNKQVITFSANEQSLIKTGGINNYASNIVSYVEAHFDLGANWQGYDSIRAIWHTQYTDVATVLDTEGICIVPAEVLNTKARLTVNLVGSISENDVLTDRLTTYPIEALIVDANARITAGASQPITPSEYEQFVATVKADADRAETAKADARGFASDAEASAENAHTSEVNASTSEDNAKVSELNAEAYKNQAQASAESASASATSAGNSATQAENAKEDAEDARDEIRSMRAEATTLEPNESATASYSDGVLSLGIPKGDKGDKGNTGDTGAPAGFGTVSATVDDTIGTPSVEVTASGADTAKNFAFAFHNLKGQKGDKGDTGDVSQTQLDAAVSDLKSDLNNVLKPLTFTLNDGRFSAYGNVINTDSSAYGAKYTSKIPISSKNSIQWAIGRFTWPHYLLVNCVLYDENEAKIGDKAYTLIASTTEERTASGIFTPDVSTAKYIAFSFWTYNEADMFKAEKFISPDAADESQMIDADLSLYEFEKAWIRASNGEKVASSATRLYKLNLNEGASISAYLHGTTNVLSAISFYSSENIATSGYMSSESIPFINSNSANWYEAKVPAGAKLTVIVTDNPTITFEPKLNLPTDEIIPQLKGYVDNEVSSIRDRVDYGTPFEFDKLWYHYGMNAVASRDVPVTIPSQSIYDIQLAHRLGFKFIELNVQPTATSGKYLVTHGLNSTLGHDFNDLNGDDAAGVAIGSTAFDTLIANYRYRSIYPQYRLPPTSLEDALLECKKLNIIPFLHYRDDTSLKMAIDIMGNNIIVYNCLREKFSGMIFDWCYYDTKAEIINRCKMFGAPYIYGMDNPFKFTDAELSEIVSEVHELGCLIGFAYYANVGTNKLLDLGFDCAATVDYLVNPFTSGNLLEAHADNTFADYQTDGTVSNGVLHLTSGQSVSLPLNNPPLVTKSCLVITFDGSITVLGSDFDSDGSSSVVITNGGVNVNNSLSVLAKSATDIISMDYYVSRC